MEALIITDKVSYSNAVNEVLKQISLWGFTSLVFRILVFFYLL